MEQNTVEQIKKKIMETERQDARFADLDLSETKIEKFTPLISNLIENCKNLEIIYFVDCNITSLTGFPPCNIKAVDFSKNLINDDSQLESLLNCRQLQQIILSDNSIKKIQTIFKLSTLKNLIQIDFVKNPIVQNPENIKIIFEKFKKIEYVNRMDRNGNEEQLEDDDLDEQQENDQYEDDAQDEQLEGGDQQKNQQSEQNDKSEPKQKNKPYKKKLTQRI